MTSKIKSNNHHLTDDIVINVEYHPKGCKYLLLTDKGEISVKIEDVFIQCIKLLAPTVIISQSGKEIESGISIERFKNRFYLVFYLGSNSSLLLDYETPLEVQFAFIHYVVKGNILNSRTLPKPASNKPDYISSDDPLPCVIS